MRIWNRMQMIKILIKNVIYALFACQFDLVIRFYVQLELKKPQIHCGHQTICFVEYNRNNTRRVLINMVIDPREGNGNAQARRERALRNQLSLKLYASCIIMMESIQSLYINPLPSIWVSYVCYYLNTSRLP